MFIRIKKGIVKEIIKNYNRVSVVTVEYMGEIHKAVNYNLLTGNVDKGDVVYLNTSANYLELGSGGYDFIILNITRGEDVDIDDDGRTIKMRYTPYQVKIFSPSDDDFYRQRIDKFRGLEDTIVITGELHSMLSPTACSLKYMDSKLKIVYIMTDGGCLPIDFSMSVRDLKDKGIISYTITSGNAFGGDFEAVNIYDALVIAKSVIDPDVIIVTMGPGMVGTGTMYGFTGIEQGSIIDSVNMLSGRPVCIPRISFKDIRERHTGISHHTLTVLSKVAVTKANISFPILEKFKTEYINYQIEKFYLRSKHNIVYMDGSVVEDALKYFNLHAETMGRSLKDDKEFFLSCGSAACLSLKMLNTG